MCKNSCSTILNQVLVSLSCIPDGYKYTFLVHVLVNVCICMLSNVPCLYTEEVRQDHDLIPSARNCLLCSKQCQHNVEEPILGAVSLTDQQYTILKVLL